MAKKTVRRCAAKKVGEHRLFSMPGLGGLLRGSTQTYDLAVGAGAGLLGQGGVKMLLDRAGLLASLPPLVQRFMPLLSGAATGAALYFLDKKVLKKGRGRGQMIGAIAAGAVVQGWQELNAQWPATFNDYVYLPSYDGMLVNRPGYAGVLMDRAQSAQNIAQLSAMSYGADGDQEEESI